MKYLLFVFVCGLVTVNSSKILMVFNHFGKSHYFQGKALGHGLARAGHDVTMISPFESSEQVKGYNEIVLDGLIEKLGFSTNFVSTKPKNVMIMLGGLSIIFNLYTENTLNHTKFQNLLKSKEKFDVIIMEDVFNAALRGLSWHYQVPLILFSGIPPTVNTLELSGNPAPPSYVSNMWVGYSERMTFWQRFNNVLFNLFEKIVISVAVNPAHERLMHKYFPGSPDLASIDKNISLYLLNDHESINMAVPRVPSMINILGFHLNRDNKLPNDLQQYMDGAKDGVIFFSFGSFVNPSEMDPQIKQAFLNSLGKLKQKVLWKTNEETVPGLPGNINLSKWLPQEAILAHPNCKLFLTHAGLLSTIETINHAVPVLAVPLAGDQALNAARIVKLGVGLSTLLSDITEETLDYQLQKLLNNDSYQKNVQLRSQLLKDRPVHPMDLAIYWVEYVIKYKDLSHMRVAGLDLPWYQYLVLDVVLVAILICTTVIFLIYILLKKLFSRSQRKIKIN